MPRLLNTLLRSGLAAAIVLLSPGLAGYAAAAQVVSVTVTGANGISGVQGGIRAIPGTSFSHAGVSLMPASLLAAPMAVPAPTPGRTVISPMVQSPVSAVVSPAPVAAPLVSAQAKVLRPLAAAPGEATAQGQAKTAPAAMAALLKGAPADSTKPEAVEVSAQRMGSLMDGMTARRSEDDTPVPAGRALVSRAAPLAKPQAAASSEAKTALPSPQAAPVKSALAFKVVLAAVIAGLLLLMPTIALAAGAPAAGVAYATSMLGYLHPGASMVAAAAGAVYGAVAARHKDGTPASSGEVLASVLRYGMLSGAGVYACMDIASVLVLGVRGAVSSLPAALATAALGQSAFQGKFKDPETSSADRIMSVFPAVATALGLSIGTAAFLPAGLLMRLGTSAMTLTGVASLLFVVTYDPAESPAGGPERMGRGYVLQALMTGLALAVSNPYLVALFAALAVWGFADVGYATVGTVGRFLQELYRRVFPVKGTTPKA